MKHVTNECKYLSIFMVVILSIKKHARHMHCINLELEKHENSYVYSTK